MFLDIPFHRRTFKRAICPIIRPSVNSWAPVSRARRPCRERQDRGEPQPRRPGLLRRVDVAVRAPLSRAPRTGAGRAGGRGTAPRRRGRKGRILLRPGAVPRGARLARPRRRRAPPHPHHRLTRWRSPLGHRGTHLHAVRAGRGRNRSPEARSPAVHPIDVLGDAGGAVDRESFGQGGAVLRALLGVLTAAGPVGDRGPAAHLALGGIAATRGSAGSGSAGRRASSAAARAAAGQKNDRDQNRSKSRTSRLVTHAVGTGLLGESGRATRLPERSISANDAAGLAAKNARLMTLPGSCVDYKIAIIAAVGYLMVHVTDGPSPAAGCCSRSCRTGREHPPCASETEALGFAGR